MNTKAKRTIIATSGGGFGEHRDTYFDCNLPAGFEHYPRDTTPIDQLIVQASGKPSPRVCCITTASEDPLHNMPALMAGLKDRFGNLGAEVAIMRLTYYAPGDAEIKSGVESADIIYISGGASYTLNQTFKRRGVDKLLTDAAEQGKVLSGLSAGLCCWFSDINASTNGKFISRVNGLGWFKALVAPHWEKEHHRHKPFHKILLDNPGLVGLAFDEYTAIEIKDDQYRLHQFAKGGQVHRGRYDDSSGHYSFAPIEIAPDFRPLSSLGVSAETN